MTNEKQPEEKKSHSTKPLPLEIKMEAMRMIDECNGNVTMAAARVGRSRHQIYQWRKKYWHLYQDTLTRKEIKEQTGIVAKTYEAVVSNITDEDDTIRDVFKKTLIEALNRVDRLLQDPTRFSKMSIRELSQLINTLVPYVINKKGAEDDPQKPNHTTFIQNIIRQMQTEDKLEKKELKNAD